MPSKNKSVPFLRLTYHRGVPYIKNMEGTTHGSQLARLSRIEGQVRGIKRMVEEERDGGDVLLQLRSVINALGKVQENIFRRHLEGCVQGSFAGADRNEKESKIEEILDLISRFRTP